MASKRLERGEWLRLAQAWKRSGLPCEEFAKREGVKPATLSWWAWKLRSGGAKVPRSRKAAPAKAKRRRSRTGAQTSQALSFVEVPASSRSLLPERDAMLELEAAGVVVRVGTGFDGPLLARVLDMLEARR